MLLVLVLVAALAVARTCGSRNQEVSKDEAIAIAREHADFEPCTQDGCVLIRALSQGMPSRLVWLVGLADELDADGNPTRVQNFVIDAETGEVSDR